MRKPQHTAIRFILPDTLKREAMLKADREGYALSKVLRIFLALWVQDKINLQKIEKK